MVTQPKKLFRQVAIDRAASPDPIDQLVQVVSPRRWLSLAAMGTLVLAGTAWSIFGSIPVTVTGQGVLVYPSEMVPVQSSGGGRILAIPQDVKVGKPVKKGQVLAVLDQSELQQQLELARRKLADLTFHDEAANIVEQHRQQLDRAAIEEQRQALQNSLNTVQDLMPEIRSKGLESIQRERQALSDRLQTLRATLPTYKDRWEKREDIFKEGAISQDLVLQAKREYQDFRAQVEQVELQLKQLDAKEVEAQRQYLQNANQANELQAKLKALDTSTASKAEQDLAAQINRNKEIQDTQRTIAQLTLQLKNSSQIISNYDGTLIELTAKAGEQIQSGGSIGTIASHKPDAELVSVVFIPVSENKNIKPGMPVQITPTMVKREEFGGIKGEVKTIAGFPTTPQGIASLVGNPDILPGLLSKEAQVAVFTDLKRAESMDSSTCRSGLNSQDETNCFTRYQWSASAGPNQPMLPGMTTSVRIEIEKRAPISYMLPFLKHLMGGQ